MNPRIRPSRRPLLEPLETRSLLSAGLVEYPISPNSRGETQAVTVDRRGNVWFTERPPYPGASEIGRISPNGKTTLFPLPGGESTDFGGITVGPDGNIWFTEVETETIGRITPGGTITEFKRPPSTAQPGTPGAAIPAAMPESITTGPDGNLWFTENGSPQIGRITPAGAITEFSLPEPASAFGITAGPDRNVWFTLIRSGPVGAIGRITPSGAVTLFPTPSPSAGPMGITAGRDGDLWFTEAGSGQIGRITPTGAITEFPLPDHTLPLGIAAGRDGNLWFTDGGDTGSAIGRITPAGAVTLFPTPSPNAVPTSIAAAPGGALWFAEFGTNAIGKLVPNVTRATLHVTPTPFHANDGSPYSGVVATFKGLPSNRAATAYSARIDWGDGMLSTGTIVAEGGGRFEVLGTHAYHRFGTYPVAVTVFDQNPRGRNPGPFASATTTAQVADAPLALSPVTVQATAGPAQLGPFALASGEVQQVPNEGDLMITINWGDGTTSVGEQIPVAVPLVIGPGQPLPVPPLVVGGSHVYNAPGRYTVFLRIHDIGGATTLLTTTADVTPPPRVGETGSLPLPTQSQVDSAYLSSYLNELQIVEGGLLNESTPYPLNFAWTSPSLQGTYLIPGIPEVEAGAGQTVLYPKVSFRLPRGGTMMNPSVLPPSVLNPVPVSYTWDLSQAPDIVATNSLNGKNLDISWQPPQRGTYGDDKITLTVPLADQTQLTETVEFLVVPWQDRAYGYGLTAAVPLYPQPSANALGNPSLVD